MDSIQVSLPGSQVESIGAQGDALRIELSRANLIKSMTGSKERTRWWQAGSLILEGIEGLPASLPTGPLICSGGDIEDNVYTYRDMIPIPFRSRGRIRFLFRFEGVDEPLDAVGTAAWLDLYDSARYIEHIRP